MNFYKLNNLKKYILDNKEYIYEDKSDYSIFAYGFDNGNYQICYNKDGEYIIIYNYTTDKSIYIENDKELNFFLNSLSKELKDIFDNIINGVERDEVNI